MVVIRLNLVFVSFFITLFYWPNALLATDSQTLRLACFYNDKNNREKAGVFAEIPYVWAKGLNEDDVYVEGVKQDGFFIVKSIKGYSTDLFGENVARYEDSDALARSFCRRALKVTFPKDHHQKDLLYMRAKSSYLSFKSAPVVFTHRNNAIVSKIDKLVAFGDSLSDQNVIKSSLLVFPGKPYSGLGCFTDDKNWIHFLEMVTGIAVQNWAVGGSVSRFSTDLEFNNKPLSYKLKRQLLKLLSGSLKQQIDNYLYTLNNGQINDPSRTSFSIWVGGNDYVSLSEIKGDADVFLDQPDDERIGAKRVIERVTENILDSIRSLYKAGGRNFLVANLPDLGTLPRVLDNDAYHGNLYESAEIKRFLLSKKMTDVTKLHNTILEKKLNNLRELEGINIVFVDVANSVNNATNSISLEDNESYFDYDLDNRLSTNLKLGEEQIDIKMGCYSGTWPSLQFNKHGIEPRRSFFFDNIHPSSFAHSLIAWVFHKTAASHGLINPVDFNTYLKLSRPELCMKL